MHVLYTVHVSYILGKALYMVLLIQTQIDTHGRNPGSVEREQTVISVIRG